MKQFKNSQQINYSKDHGSSSPIEREILQVFFFKIFNRCSMCPPLVKSRHLCDSPSHSTRVSAYHGRPEPQQRWYGCENLEISREWRQKDSVLHKPPEEKVALNRRRLVFQSRSGLWRRVNLFPLPGIETLILGRPARSLVILQTTPLLLLNITEIDFKWWFRRFWTLLSLLL